MTRPAEAFPRRLPARRPARAFLAGEGSFSWSCAAPSATEMITGHRRLGRGPSHLPAPATTILAEMPELGGMGANRQRRWRGSRPSPAARASGGGAPSSAAAGRTCRALHAGARRCPLQPRHAGNLRAPRRGRQAEEPGAGRGHAKADRPRQRPAPRRPEMGATCRLTKTGTAQGRDPGRARRRHPLGNPILHLLPFPHRRRRRHRGARALSDREPPPLGPRRYLHRRSVPPPQRPRRPQHGHRPPLRPQPRPHRHRQAIHQVPKEDRRMEPRLSRHHPRLTPRLTWIWSPDVLPPRGGHGDRRQSAEPAPSAVMVNEPSGKPL